MISRLNVANVAKVSSKVISNRSSYWGIKPIKINGTPFYNLDDANFLSYKSNKGQALMPFEVKERAIMIYLIDKGVTYKVIAEYCKISMKSVNNLVLAYKKDNCITMESRINRLKY